MNKQNNIVVSVIIPNRNRYEKLTRSVKSVATQTYQNVELVIVDDGSDQRIDYDAIKRMWNDYRPSYFLKIIQQQHSNANVARNRGADEAIGDYLIFLDSDDLLALWAIETRLKLSNEHRGIICGNAECFNVTPGDLKIIWNLPTEENILDRFLKLDIPWQTAGPMWPKQVFYRIGKYNEKLISSQEWELFIRALTFGVEFKHFLACDFFIDSSGDDKTSHKRLADIDHLINGFLLMGLVEKMLHQYDLANKQRINSLQMNRYFLAYLLMENQGYTKTIEFIKQAPLDNSTKLERKLLAYRLSQELPAFLQKKIKKKIWGKVIEDDDSDKLMSKFSIPDLLASNKLK